MFASIPAERELIREGHYQGGRMINLIISQRRDGYQRHNEATGYTTISIVTDRFANKCRQSKPIMAQRSKTQLSDGATNAGTATALDLLQKDRGDKEMDTTTTLRFSENAKRRRAKTTLQSRTYQSNFSSRQRNDISPSH